MPRCALLALALLISGCVAAYDPSSPGRLGMDTRAQEIGVKESAPWVRGRRTRPKPAPAPSAPTIVQAAQPEAPLSQPSQPVAAAPQSPAGTQLEWWLGILRGGDTRRLDGHFADEFLAKVPGAKLREIARSWRRDEMSDGPVELVTLEEEGPTRLTAVVRGASTDRYTRIILGVADDGRISTLWLGPLAGYKRADLDTWAKVDARLGSFPGAVALASYELQGQTLRPVHTFGADRDLAIGSTFKLYILGALAEEVAAGRIKWDEPLAIKDDLKSLPGGKMQLETEGVEYPISTFADLMISISDNTAADHVLDRVGRAAVEAYMLRLNPGAGNRNVPFLSTMDMFKLKLAPDRTLADRYARADAATRRAMLAPQGEVGKATPSLVGAALWKAPFEIDRIEWFASAEQCCRVMADLHRLERLSAGATGMEPLARALRLNPGLQFDSKIWPSIAYKGGSEPGVLNMTWLLQRDDGRWFLVSLGWNDPAKDVDLKAAADLAGAAVALTAEEGRPVK